MPNYEGIFRKGTNYKVTFTQEVENLLTLEMELPERMRVIDNLLVAYVKQTGEIPDSTQINRLADFILREDLRNRHPDKVTNTQFPFLSEGQLRLRERREVPTDTSKMSNNIKYRINGRKKSRKEVF